MHAESLTREAMGCRKLAAKLKRKAEKRLMLKVAKAFEELAAREASIADHGLIRPMRSCPEAPQDPGVAERPAENPHKIIPRQLI